MTDTLLPPVMGGNPGQVAKPQVVTAQSDPGRGEVHYITYKKTTGEVIGKQISTGPIPPETAEMGVIIGEDHTQHLHYVDIATGEVVPRMEFPGEPSSLAPPVGSVVTITDIPAGMRFQLGSQEVIVDDGILELNIETAGSYLLMLNDFRYIQKVWRIRTA